MPMMFRSFGPTLSFPKAVSIDAEPPIHSYVGVLFQPAGKCVRDQKTEKLIDFGMLEFWEL